MKVNSLAVFCGSKPGKDPIYVEEALILGKLMAQHKINLIYGGGNKGLMGAVADAVMQGGGNVTGIIPAILLEWEQQHEGITDLQIVADMHVRKKMMYELCDAAIVLPGGNGTLDELFEMLTWNTLKIHSKKIILMNCGNYYDHLIEHVKKMQHEDFLYEEWDERLIVCTTATEAINFLI